MQPCQRRTIGGTEGRGGRVILATHPSSTHLCLSSALHLIPFPVYAVIARPGGDIGVRMDRHKGMRLFASPSPFLSIYLSISSNPLSLATTCAHTHTRARIYSLSLSPFRWSSVSVRRVGTSGASMIPSRSVDSACPPLALYNAAPTVRYSVRLRSSGEEGNGLWAEGDPRNLAKLARRNYRYWATTYRHGISSSHPLFDLDATEARRESAGFHTWMITTLLAAPLYA